MTSCVVVGNIPERIEIVGKKKDNSASASFVVAYAAKKLGCDNVTLVSKMSRNFNKEYMAELEKTGVKVIPLSAWEDTKYEVSYSKRWDYKNKKVRIVSDAGPIVDVPNDISGDIVLFAAYYGKISLNVFKKLKKPENIVALDCQNFVKERDSNTKELIFVPWLERKEILDNVDILKFNTNFMQYITGNTGINSVSSIINLKGYPQVVLLTLYTDWGYVFFKNKFFRTVLYKVAEKSVLGAGEVYMTAYAIKYYETKDVKESMYFAVAAASFALEKNILDNKAFTRENVDKRTKELKDIFLI